MALKAPAKESPPNRGELVSLRRKISSLVDETANELIGLLQELIAFRSENSKFLAEPDAQAAAREQEEAAQRRIAGWLADLGMSVDLWDVLTRRPNVVGRCAGSGGGRSLILNGHVDVVPAGDETLWTKDPWLGEVSQGRIWGRGSCDMKGGLAAGIGALRVLRRLGLRLRGDIFFESVVDEEMGGLGTRATIERGYKADGAIVLEPSGGALHPVEGGLEWVRLVVRGASGHSAVRYRSVHAGGRGRAVNAIEKMAKLLAAIQELERHWGNTKVHALMPLGITTIHPGVVLGGSGGGEHGTPRDLTTFGNFSDYCSLGLSIKYLPDEDVESVKNEFEGYVRTVSDADSWLKENPPEIEWGADGVSFPPAEISLDHPLAEAAGWAYGQVVGEPVWSGFEAVSDLAWLAQGGVPGLIYGPGSIEQAHAPDEFLEIDELLRATKVIALTAAAWCEVSNSCG